MYYNFHVSYYKCCRGEGYREYCAFASVESAGKEKNLVSPQYERFPVNICTASAEIRLLLLFRICIASPPKSESSSPKPLLDDQL